MYFCVASEPFVKYELIKTVSKQGNTCILKGHMKKKYWSVSRLLLLLSIPMGLMLASCEDSGNAKRPSDREKYNIVFITTDQEAYMPSYPKESNYEARERLRRIGTSFEKHYACSNVSTSSRSVMYTGRHVTETGMLDNTNLVFQPDMDTDIKTVGDMMTEAGYYAAYKGKWHISRHEDSLEDYGFKDWTEGNIYGSVWEGFHADSTIAARACEWLSTTGMERNSKGQPFFLAVNFINPHDIMYFCESQQGGSFGSATAPDAPVYKKKYPSVPVPASWEEPLDKEGRPSAHYQYQMGWDKVTGLSPQTEEQWRTFRDYYFNCIQDCDNQMNRLLDHLFKLGLMKNTIIVYTSDHGEMMGEHGLKGKGGNIYENNIHVPLIIYHPDYVGGRSCKSITSHLDLAPTFVDMATGNANDANRIKAGVKGHSLMQAMIYPEAPMRNQEGALFVYDMISMIDDDPVVEPQSNGEINMRVDLSNRGYLRGVITKDYKFARYFSPLRFNTPATLDSLYANNDVELYSMGTVECENMAYPQGRYEELVDEYNSVLNDVIAREIGVDDGRETQKFKGGIERYGK